MPEHLTPATTAQVPPQLPESVESSRAAEAINYGKRLIGRGALILGLTAATGAVIGTASEMADPNPRPAAADTGGYPDYNKPCVAVGDEQYGETEGTGYWCSGYQWGDSPSQQNSSRGFGYRNCTDWAAFRAEQLTGVDVPYGQAMGHAKNWNDNAPSGWVKDQTPEPADIAVSEGLANDPFGHVGIVEKVNKNAQGGITSIEVSEYNKGADGNYSWNTYTPDANGVFWRDSAKTKKWDTFLDLNGTGNGIDTAYSSIPDGREFHDGGYVYTKVGGSAWPIEPKSTWTDADKTAWGGDDLLGPVPTSEVQDHEAGFGASNAHPPRDGTAVYVDGGNGQQYYFVKGRAYPIGAGELAELGVVGQALAVPAQGGRLSGFTGQQLVLDHGEVYKVTGDPAVRQAIYVGGNAAGYHVNNDTVKDCLRLTQGKTPFVIPQSARSSMALTDVLEAAGCTFPPGMVLRGPGGAEQWRIEGNNPYTRRYYPSALLTYLHTSGNPNVQELSSAASINNLTQGPDMSVPEGMAFVDQGNGAEFVYQNGEWHHVPWPDMNTCLGLEPWEIVQVPSVAVGALPQGAQATCEYSNRVVAHNGVNYYIDNQGQSHVILNEAVKNCVVVRRSTGPVGDMGSNPTVQYPAGEAAYCPYETDPGINFVHEGSNPTVWVMEVGEDGKLYKRHASGFCLPDPLTTQHKKYHLFSVPVGETAGIPDGPVWSPSPEACAALPGDGLIVNQYN